LREIEQANVGGRGSSTDLAYAGLLDGEAFATNRKLNQAADCHHSRLSLRHP